MTKQNDEVLALAIVKIGEAEASIQMKTRQDGGLDISVEHFRRACQLLRDSLVGTLPETERDRVIEEHEAQEARKIEAEANEKPSL